LGSWRGWKLPHGKSSAGPDSPSQIAASLWHTDAMRTTLEIDDELIGNLLARHPGVSKREAVERAIRGYLSSDAVARVRELAGSLHIEDVSVEQRGRDRRA